MIYKLWFISYEELFISCRFRNTEGRKRSRSRDKSNWRWYIGFKSDLSRLWNKEKIVSMWKSSLEIPYYIPEIKTSAFQKSDFTLSKWIILRYQCYIDVGDGCSRRNVLKIIFGKLSDLFLKNFEKKYLGILLSNEIIRANHEMRF